MKLLKIGSSEAHNRFSSGLWICLGAMKGALTPSLCNGASSSDQRGSSRNRSPPDSTPAGQGDKDRSADQSLKRRANLNAIVKGMYMSGHTEALKEEKMPGILDRVVARAAPRR